MKDDPDKWMLDDLEGVCPVCAPSRGLSMAFWLLVILVGTVLVWIAGHPK